MTYIMPFILVVSKRNENDYPLSIIGLHVDKCVSSSFVGLDGKYTFSRLAVGTLKAHSKNSNTEMRKC